MIDPAELSGFFGFTEKEVYNPKSVVDAVRRGRVKSYWTGTETYEALKFYIFSHSCFILAI